MNKLFIFLAILIIAVLAINIKYINNPSQTSNYESSVNTTGDKIKTISHNGETVSLENFCVEGGVTIFDFYADWCGPCRTLGPQLESAVKKTPNVFLRKINIKAWKSPVANQYRINSIPSIWIYDKNGQIAYRAINGMGNISIAVGKLL